MQRETFYFRLGKRIGYWYAANRASLHRRIFESIVYRLPGGRWIARIFMQR